MTQKDGLRALAVCLVIGLGAFGLYAPAMGFSFVSFDEMLGNPHLAKGVFDTLGWAVVPGNGAVWQPLTWASHAVDVQLYGTHAWGHHATSILLHALNSVLVFLVLRRLTGAFWRSAFVAGLFAWHPLHVEAVAWIAQRSGVLCGFFWLLTMWAYARYQESLKAKSPGAKLFYIAAILIFALAVMSNIVAVTLPIVLLLLDWWPLGRLAATPERSFGKQFSILVIEKIPFLVLSGVGGAMMLIAESRSHVMEQMVWLPFRIRFATAGMSLFHYLAKSIWPSDLAATYPFVLHWDKISLIIVALVLVAITVVAFQVRKTRPFWLTGWLWFLVVLIPVLNIFQPGAQVMADRYIYLPSIGLWMLFCWEAYDLAERARQSPTVLAGVSAVVLVACIVLSWIQLGVWKDEGTLLARIPESNSNAAGHAEYASFLLRNGKLPQAQAECEKAVSITTNAAGYEVLLGDIMLAEGKPDDAMQKYQLSLKENPKADVARIGLGRAFLAKKKPADAAEEFKLVTYNLPKSHEAHLWLARALLLQGKASASIPEFQASLKLQLNQPEALNELAWLEATDPHAENRKGTEAVQLAARACELSRGQEPAFIGTLAAGYAETGDFEKAVKFGQQARDLAAAQGRKGLAAANDKLLALYRAHKPFRENGEPVTPAATK